jgi:hypothetical protein
MNDRQLGTLTLTRGAHPTLCALDYSGCGCVARASTHGSRRGLTSYAPPGLGWCIDIHLNPRLTPWAVALRPSGALPVCLVPLRGSRPFDASLPTAYPWGYILCRHSRLVF